MNPRTKIEAKQVLATNFRGYLWRIFRRNPRLKQFLDLYLDKFPEKSQEKMFLKESQPKRKAKRSSCRKPLKNFYEVYRYPANANANETLEEFLEKSLQKNLLRKTGKNPRRIAWMKPNKYPLWSFRRNPQKHSWQPNRESWRNFKSLDVF